MDGYVESLNYESSDMRREERIVLLQQAHFLLTYACNLECDHCFVYSSPSAEGTFTSDQMKKVMRELRKLGTVDYVFFEGGEPFLYYPLMLEGIRLARDAGFDVGIVTNGYWATDAKDAELWLRPLKELDLAGLSVSDDEFHYEDKENAARCAMRAAKKLHMSSSSITIETPRLATKKGGRKGEPVVGGGIMFRGRAVEKLVDELPRRPWREFPECPYEDLRDPKRVHLDSYGNVHLCQGLSMGNMWRTPLSRLVKNYDVGKHPIAGPLEKGGPALLAKTHKVKHEDRYVDACHMCYAIRLALLDRFPECLAPRQCYGIM